MLLPVVDYLPGAMLPPHLSPFVDNSETGYVPPEKQRINEIKMGKAQSQIDQSAALVQQKKTEVKEVMLKNSSKKASKKHETTPKNGTEEIDDNDAEFDMKVDLDSPDEGAESESSESEIEEDEEKTDKKKKPQITVAKAKPKEENTNVLLKKQAAEEKRLSELMIPKKDKRLYDKIVKSKKKQRQEVCFLIYQ